MIRHLTFIGGYCIAITGIPSAIFSFVFFLPSGTFNDSHSQKTQANGISRKPGLR